MPGSSGTPIAVRPHMNQRQLIGLGCGLGLMIASCGGLSSAGSGADSSTGDGADRVAPDVTSEKHPIAESGGLREGGADAGQTDAAQDDSVSPDSGPGFPCGSELSCKAVLEYCLDRTTGSTDGGGTHSYSCQPYPRGCAPTPTTCICLVPSHGCGCEEEDAGAGFYVRCF